MARRCVLLLVALGGAFARKEIDLNKLDKEYRADDDDAAWETAAQKRRREAAKAAAPGAGFPGTGAPGETISNDVMQEMIARAKANGKFTQGGTGGLGAAAPPTDDDDDDGDDAAKLPFDAEPDGVWKDADNSMKLMSAFLRDGECDDVACCAEATRLFVALLRTGGVTQLMPKCMAPNELLLVLQGSSAAASSSFGRTASPIVHAGRRSRRWARSPTSSSSGPRSASCSTAARATTRTARRAPFRRRRPGPRRPRRRSAGRRRRPPTRRRTSSARRSNMSSSSPEPTRVTRGASSRAYAGARRRTSRGTRAVSL